MLKAILFIATATAVLSAASPAAAEPAHADPTFISAVARSPAVLRHFTFAGANVDITARGRRASIDTQRRLKEIEEAVEMAGVFPGYPQPALVTFDMRVSF